MGRSNSLIDIEKAYITKLAASGLGTDEAKKLRFRLLSEKTAATELAGLIPVFKAGFLIPYFDATGKPTKFWRYRYLEGTKRGFEKSTTKKDLRYIQPPKSVNEIYLPPLLDWKLALTDTSKSLLITEGELKAACAARFSFYCIGLGGVWSWRSARNGLHVLPQLEAFTWTGRKVTIVFDSDAANNHMVAQAENALARELTKMGAVVSIARIPPTKSGEKQGLDDFVMSAGVEAFVATIKDAFEWKSSQELHRLNEEVVYVQVPGLVARLDTLQKISPRAFYEHAYAPRIFYEETITEKGVKLTEKSAAKEWLKWAHRASVRQITYMPGEARITPLQDLNAWPGWGLEPKKGDVGPWKKLLDFVFKGLSRENRKWVEQWMAYPIQHPGTKLYSALVIWGLVHGTGKSTIGYSLGEIYGTNFVEIKDQDLVSNYNEWAENRQFVMGDEITGGDKRGSADRMKSMITQRQLRLNIKYIPSYSVPDCINYLFTSNHPDAFFLEDTDRRFFIHEVAGEPMPFEFYQGYLKWLREEGGREALFHHLLHVDLSGFNPQAHAPMTEAKAEMIDNGKSDVASWVATLKRDPMTVLRLNNQLIERDLWTTTELLRLYDPSGNGRVTLNGLSRELRRAGMVKANGGAPLMTHEGTQRLWIIRNHTKHLHSKAVVLARAFAHERGVKSGKY